MKELRSCDMHLAAEELTRWAAAQTCVSCSSAPCWPGSSEICGGWRVRGGTALRPPAPAASWRWWGPPLCTDAAARRDRPPAAPPWGEDGKRMQVMSPLHFILCLTERAEALTSEAMVKPITSMQPSSCLCGSKSLWSPVLPHGMVPAQYLQTPG